MQTKEEVIEEMMIEIYGHKIIDSHVIESFEAAYTLLQKHFASHKGYDKCACRFENETTNEIKKCEYHANKETTNVYARCISTVVVNFRSLRVGYGISC